MIPNRPLHILLVEDNPGDARLIREELKEPHVPHEVIHSTRLDDAMVRLRESGESRIDVVLLDLSLPDRTGLATLRDLRRLRPSLPVVVMTFHPEGEFKAAARDADGGGDSGDAPRRKGRRKPAEGDESGSTLGPASDTKAAPAADGEEPRKKKGRRKPPPEGQDADPAKASGAPASGAPP